MILQQIALSVLVCPAVSCIIAATEQATNTTVPL